jgi:fluoroquinolone resistance protein
MSKFLLQTEFMDCKITGVNWTSLDWSRITIASPISFESCDISFSVFNSLQLNELGLRNSKAHDVDFSECDLKGADFFKSDLMDSRFSLSKLDNCNFQEAINYYIDPIENSIKGAKFSSPEVLSLLSRFKINID